MYEEVLKPLGMEDSSYVWRPSFERRMAVGYDEEGRRDEVYAIIGRRSAELAAEWNRPLLDWRYEDAARAVQLVNPQWAVLVHDAERCELAAHHDAGLREVSGAPRGAAPSRPWRSEPQRWRR